MAIFLKQRDKWFVTIVILCSLGKPKHEERQCGCAETRSRLIKPTQIRDEPLCSNIRGSDKEYPNGKAGRALSPARAPVNYVGGSWLTSTVTRLAVIVLFPVKITVAVGSNGSGPSTHFTPPVPA